MLKHRKFKLKLLFVQLITIIPFLLFIFYLFDLWYDTSRSAVLNDSITTNRLIASFINEQFNSGLKNAKILSSDVVYTTMMANPQVGKKIIDEVIKTQPNIFAINVFDTTGRLVATTLGYDTSKNDVSAADRDYFKSALQTKQPVISEALTGLITKTNLVIMAAPIIINGEVKGVLTTSYNLQYLKSEVEKIVESNDNNTIILVDNKNRIAFTTHKPYPTSEKEKTVLENDELVKSALDGKIGTVENKIYPDFGSSPLLGSSAPIENYGWVVVNLQPMNNIFAPLFTVQKMVWMILLTALIFSVTLSSYFLRKVKIIY